MKILIFYDNLIRDYRGLLLLEKILQKKGHRVFLKALWKDAIENIILIKPDIVIMGQIGEYSTSVIGLFCKSRNITLVLNSTENIWPKDLLDTMFKIDFKERNSDIIYMQTITGKDTLDFVLSNPQIKNKSKYKFIGFPRFDLSLDEILRKVEVNKITQKYNLSGYKKIYLYVSSFIHDEVGGQIDQENEKDFSSYEQLHNEKILKETIKPILKSFIQDFVRKDNVLLIKKHPWDKSYYYDKNFKSQNCIILDSDEYIVPVLAVSDLILHKESTAAVEAWIMNKKTISISPEFKGDRNTLCNHMKYELIAKNFEELCDIIHGYPVSNPSIKFLDNFKPFLDSRSTVRLADEICKLPKKINTISQKERLNILTLKLKKGLRNLLKPKKESDINPSDYMYFYRLWEQKKPEINKLYKKPYNDYINKNV